MIGVRASLRLKPAVAALAIAALMVAALVIPPLGSQAAADPCAAARAKLTKAKAKLKKLKKKGASGKAVKRAKTRVKKAKSQVEAACAPGGGGTGGGPTGGGGGTPPPADNPPVISNVGDIRATQGQSVNVTATVTDETAVGTVKLFYRPEGSTGSFIPAQMNNSGGTSYQTTIPNVSQDLEYYVEASDTTGHTVRKPDPSTYLIGFDHTVDAPALDTTEQDSVFDSTSFLWQGVNSPQTGVSGGTISPDRAAAIRGTVKDRSGDALSGALITVLDHPEYGQTHTGDDGTFTMAVNGVDENQNLTVDVERPGFIGVQRAVTPRFQEWATADPIVLTPYDPAATDVAFSADTTGYQVARGTQQSDSDGSRQATLLVQPGTTAQLNLPGGGQQGVGTGTVRLTEFTVGTSGPDAMPAELPATSLYTYATDITLDQAINAGATGVTLSKPASFYAENFVHQPVGATVPLGFYDRSAGEWKAEPDGIVLGIVSETNGMADVNLDDTAGADADLYDDIGLTDGERAKLAELYDPGDELTRVQLDHFSPHDANYPAPTLGFHGYPALRSQLLEWNRISQAERDAQENGYGTVDVGSGAFQEDAQITGEPFQLHYASQRQPGAGGAYVTPKVQVTPTNPDPNFDKAVLELDVAGQQITQTYTAPDQFGQLRWNGRDAFGRLVSGEQNATLKLTHYYEVAYNYTQAKCAGSCGGGSIAPAYSFGRSAANAQQGGPARFFYPFTTSTTIRLGTSYPDSAGLGGWDLSIHHSYDPIDHSVQTGDGRTISSMPRMQTVAGNGSLCSTGPSFFTCSEGGAAGGGTVAEPTSMAALADGRIAYFEEYNHSNLIRAFRPGGTIQTIAGGGSDHGDSVPAMNYQAPDSPQSLAAGPDGSLYWVEFYGCTVRRLKDGIVTRVAGNGTCGVPDSGDGGPATDAILDSPRGIAVGSDGAVYVSDVSSGTVRRIDPSGTISTIAGVIHQGCGDYTNGCNFGAPAAGQPLGPVDALAIDPNNGILYMSVGPYNGNKITVDAINPSGTLERVAGGCCGSLYDDGIPATQAVLPESDAGHGYMAVGPDGSLYLATDPIVRQISSDGIIRTVAGDHSNATYHGEDVPARQGGFPNAFGLTFDGSGNYFFADPANSRIREVSDALPGYDGQNIRIPSPDGSEIWTFTKGGRHLSTKDALTGATIWSFGYNGAGQLSTVTDRDGDVTQIQRSGSGVATAIVSPDGDGTGLQINGADDLTEVRNPAGEATSYGYDSQNHLLNSITGPRSNQFGITYNADGEVTRADAPAGEFTTYSRSEDPSQNKRTVVVTTALGRQTTVVSQLAGDGNFTRTITGPDGHDTTTVDSEELGTSDTTLPDGSTRQDTYGPDPRFGLQAPFVKSTTIDSPSHASLTTTQTISTMMSDPLDPFSALESMEVQSTTNGDTTTVAYDSSSRTVTTTTPEGRSSSQVLNTAGRLSATQLPEQDPIDTTYDPQGRLSGGGQGSGLSRRSETRTFRSATTAQGPAGTLQTDTRPEGGAFDYTFDPARRPTSQSLPEGGSLNYGYDDSGNTSSIALPGGQTHQFAYDSRDLLSTYTPPTVAGGGPTGYSYNADRQPTQIDPPGSHEIDFSYGSEGRLGALDTPEGNQTYAYDSGTGQLTSIAGGANTLSLSHDGPLPTGESWSGTVTGSLTRSFDADLRVGSDTVAGSTVNYTYDNDGLPTGTSGQLNATVTRSAASGRVSRIDQGSLREDRGYDPNFAELTSQDVSYSGSARYSTSYTRDHLGRILQKTETIGGQTTTTDYAYDGNGRLTEAKNSGASSTDYVYSYDLNGNRTGGGRTYDNQDRLTGDGTHTYTYTPDGYLWGRTGGSGPVSYSYDSKGELTQASGSGLAGGSTQVDYVYDPLGRRIQRSDGTTTTRYLWDGPRLAAVLDGSNGLLERFVYLTRSNVPDLMKAGGTEYRIVSDQTGSVREVIDTSTGSIVQRIDYDPFGNVTGDTNPGFQPFGFAGGLFDPATGLTRFGARDYDAADGRWTSQDPLSFAAGETNLYSYCGSDPVNLVDPTGTGPGAFYNQASTYFGGSDQLSAVGSLSRLGLLGAAGTVLGLFDASKDLVVGNLKQSFGNSRQAEEGAAQTLKGFTNLGLGSLTAVPALIDVNTSTGFFARATTGPLAVLGAVDAVAVNLAAESIDAAHHGRPTPVDTAVDYWGQTVLGKATVGIWSHFGHSDPAPVLVTRGYGNAMGIKG